MKTERLYSPIYILAFTLFISLTDVNAQDLHYGESFSLGDGVVSTWTEVDADGTPLIIGVSFEAGVLSNLPSSVVQRALDLPDVVSDSLFDHVLFDWNPHGHWPAGIYSLPHFDIHFVVVSQTKRSGVLQGADLTPVDEQYLPSDYGTYDTPPFAVARMGVHYLDLLSPEWNGESFTRTLIYGFYDGEFFFIEPMITRSFLLMQPDETNAIRQPDAFQKSGYYPTAYRINYDATEQVYHVVITDFVHRQADSNVH